MILARPTVYNEIPISHSFCGQCVGAGVASDWLQRSVSPQEFDSHIPGNLRINGGTTGAALAAALRSLQVPATYREGTPMSSYAPAALAKRHRFINLTQCNGYANPVPVGSTRIAHWRDGYGLNGDLDTANPWGGVYNATPTSTMYAADLQAWVEVQGVMPKDEVSKLTLSEKQAWARDWYAIFCGRDPESDQALNNWANAIADDGSNLNEVSFRFRSAPEAYAWNQKLRQAVLNPQAPGDPATASRVAKITTAIYAAGQSLVVGAS